jgi:hypothetical protein
VQDRVEKGVVLLEEVEFSHNGCVRVVHNIQKQKALRRGRSQGLMSSDNEQD